MAFRIINSFDDFDEFVTVDFEYSVLPGGVPVVINMSAHENVSGRSWVLWTDELQSLDQPPFQMDEGALYICYNATAEFSDHHSLGGIYLIIVLICMLKKEFCKTGKYQVPAHSNFHLH